MKFRPLVEVEAVQFDPTIHPWPDGVHSWEERQMAPRDMSWGFLDTEQVHIWASDWNVLGTTGKRFLVSDDVFRSSYMPVLTDDVSPEEWAALGPFIGPATNEPQQAVDHINGLDVAFRVIRMPETR